jgi:hypothetical protein
VINMEYVEEVKPEQAINRTFPYSYMFSGILAILLALPLAFLINRINAYFSSQLEKGVMVIAIVLVVIMLAPVAAYLVWTRQNIDIGKVGLLLLGTACVVLLSIYLFQAIGIINFPADFVIWSESDFLNMILMLRTGHPLYTAQINNESSIYTPGSQVLTYAIARFLGYSTSISMFRMIQVGFTVLSALIAVLCCIELMRLTFTNVQDRGKVLWGFLMAPLLFLMATNSITNPFVEDLHNDSLAQLISVAAYWFLLLYISKRSGWVLGLMALVPAVGFLVKQSLVIWAPLYICYLFLFDSTRSWRRIAIFTLVAFGAIGLAILICYLLWGNYFIYWTISVLGNHPRSLLRSFQHLLDGWAYYMIGFVSGYILLQGKNFKQLLGAWLVWLGFFLVLTETSGIAWMTNHMGPGSLIAGVWFVPALIKIWPKGVRFSLESFKLQSLVKVGMLVPAVGLLLNGLGTIRIPIQILPDDANRYVNQIEAEFQGEPVNRVLLDVGSWIYFKNNVVMKDRATSMGDRGYAGNGDFSGMLQRIQDKYYVKILVRNLNSPDFWYDSYLWSKSSGVHQALLDNYHVIRTIDAVSGPEMPNGPPYLFDQISVLVPNTN